MVKFKQLVNPLILNDGWEGFQGNSEFKGKKGKLHMGYWSFLGILDDEPTADDWKLEDDIEEEIFLTVCGEWNFRIINAHGQVCAVKFSY